MHLQDKWRRLLRRIHTELAKAGRRGINVEVLHENLDFEYPLLLEALKKLEKLRRIEWLDDGTVVIVDSLKESTGRIYDVYIEKVVQGKALVLVNDKWHARLNHYDYAGPKIFLKVDQSSKLLASSTVKTGC